MPHVSIELSKGAAAPEHVQSICNDVFTALSRQAAFPNPAVIKVRAHVVDVFATHKDCPTFAHATFSLMAGRDEATRKTLNQAILDVLVKALPEVASLTVQDIEMTATTYAKRLL